MASAPAGLACRPDCTETYPAGAVVTLVATPAPGSVFRGLSGGGCAGTEPRILSGAGTVTVTARFEPAVPGSRPRILAPGDGGTLVAGPTVTFQWTAVPGAALYGVECTGRGRRFASPNGTAGDLVNGYGGPGGFGVEGTGVTLALRPEVPPAPPSAGGGPAPGSGSPVPSATPSPSWGRRPSRRRHRLRPGSVSDPGEFLDTGPSAGPSKGGIDRRALALL